MEKNRSQSINTDIKGVRKQQIGTDPLDNKDKFYERTCLWFQSKAAATAYYNVNITKEVAYHMALTEDQAREMTKKFLLKF